MITAQSLFKTTAHNSQRNQYLNGESQGEIEVEMALSQTDKKTKKRNADIVKKLNYSV